MSNLNLVLASPANQLMANVITEWDRQLASQKIPKSALDAVRTYEAQLQPDKTYGVYILCSPDGMGGGKPPYEAFVHVNHAFPKSPKPMLRMTWNRLAPRYEWSANPINDHARVFTGIVTGGLKLIGGPLPSKEMKVYLYNHADRAFGKRFVGALTGMPLPFNVSLQGNWLHLGL
ncbi:hypothetical protein [Acidisphaera sp. S103]|uniref:hypothetical protein n=1 Tax=Acidisphaera sp. S103 TaxID=1747223 RepID=UPI00131C3847|nr:hypothetical protein [Acidisphaera sp. S103]